MNDVKYDVLKAILEYMYLGEVHITNENLKDFIKTAEGLQIRGLSKENNVSLSFVLGDLTAGWYALNSCVVLFLHWDGIKYKDSNTVTI